MPSRRSASPPPTAAEWARGKFEEEAALAQGSLADSTLVPATLAQRRQVARTPALALPRGSNNRREEEEEEEFLTSKHGSLSSRNDLQPPSPHSPLGLLLFRRRSSTSVKASDEEDRTSLPIHPFDGPSSRRASDAASSALNQISSGTTSRRSSWSTPAVEGDNTRPPRPSTTQYLPPPAASSANFAASSLLSATSSSRYNAGQPLFSIEASPLIPSSFDSTPRGTPESTVELSSTPTFSTPFAGKPSPEVESFDLHSSPTTSDYAEASPRRPSYSVITLDPSPRTPSISFLSTPSPRSARSIRRQLRRVLLASISLVVLLCIVRPYRIEVVPAFARLYSLAFPSHFDTEHYLTEPMRSGLVTRNKTFPEKDKDEEAVASSVEAEGIAREYPIREEIKAFREEQLWAGTEPKLRTRVVEPRAGAGHEATIVMIHGLTQTIEHNSWLHTELAAKLPFVRWVMPQAPEIPITYHQKHLRPGWFDIKSFPWNAVKESDDEHYFASTRAINSIIREERDRLIDDERKRTGRERTANSPATKEEREAASRRILVGGFSQGGVMTLLAGLTNEEKLGGLFVFSGMLPLRELLPELVRDLDRADLPIWWGHGEIDPYLLPTDAALSVESLRKSSPGLALSRVTFHTYPHLAHTWSRKQVEDLTTWMKNDVGGPFQPRELEPRHQPTRSRRRR